MENVYDGLLTVTIERWLPSSIERQKSQCVGKSARQLTVAARRPETESATDDDQQQNISEGRKKIHFIMSR